MEMTNELIRNFKNIGRDMGKDVTDLKEKLINLDEEEKNILIKSFKAGDLKKVYNKIDSIIFNS